MKDQPISQFERKNMFETIAIAKNGAATAAFKRLWQSFEQCS